MDNQTMDGLYFYTQAERQNAGTELYNDLSTQIQQAIANTIPAWFSVSAGFVIGILAQASPVIPALAAALGISQNVASDFIDLWTNLPSKIANQVCNAFASDWCDQAAINSSNWQNPGDGRAVSPDNIQTFWDQPNPAITDKIHGLYGFFETLITVPGRWEQRPVCVWTQSLGTAEIIVRVTYHGNQAPGALVQAACQEGFVPLDGDVKLTIPSGTYLVTASVVWSNGWFLQGSTPVTVSPNEVKVVGVQLQDPPEVNRLIIVNAKMDIYDKQVIGSDNWDHPQFFGEFLIGPPDPSNLNQQVGTSYPQSWDSQDIVGLTGGETHVSVTIEAIWLQDLSAILRVQVVLYDVTDVDEIWNNYQSPWVIAKDTGQSWIVNIENGEVAPDGATVTLNFRNNRQNA